MGNLFLVYSIIGVLVFIVAGSAASDLKFKEKEQWGIACLFGWGWPIMLPVVILYMMVYGAVSIRNKLKNKDKK